MAPPMSIEYTHKHNLCDFLNVIHVVVCHRKAQVEHTLKNEVTFKHHIHMSRPDKHIARGKKKITQKRIRDRACESKVDTIVS